MTDSERPALDAALIRKVEVLFPECERAEVQHLLLEDCADLPFMTGQRLLPVQAGVLKLSGGRLDKLRESIAIRDWRDILVYSGFQNSAALKEWLDS